MRSHQTEHVIKARHLSSEQGVFLFLSATIIVTLITSLLFLGYYSIQTRRVSSLLRKHADQICQELSYAPMLPERAWISFQDLVQDIDLKHGRITHAELTLPLMPDRVGDPPFCRDFDSNRLDACGDDIRCTLVTSVCGDTQYPSSVWNSERDIGSAVGCQLTAQVNPLGTGILADLIGDTSNVARVVWSRPFFQASEEETLQALEDNSITLWKNHPFGLTLIVSPHMTTYGGLRRFQFQDTTQALSFPDRFLNLFDPLSKPASSSFEFHNKERLYPKTTEKGEAIFIPPVGPLATNRTALHSQKYDSPLDDREEMIVACSNPASLIRNIIASTFIELASRDIRLRTSTDVIVPGTANRIWTTQQDLFEKPNSTPPMEESQLDPPMPNSPILIVSKGSDLRAKHYQLPFISFYGGVASPATYYNTDRPFEPDPHYESAPLLGRADIHEEAGYPDSLDLRQGWILPFATKNSEGEYDPLYARTLGEPEDHITENDRRLNLLRTMISSQLRWCSHLYARNTGVSFDLHSYLRTESYEEENDSLETDAYRNSPYSRDSYNSGESWGPPCSPWSAQGCVDGNRLSNAYEVVMQLGTIQQCPFEMDFPELSEGDLLEYHLRTNSPPTCKKPTRAGIHLNDITRDLTPDYEGLFYFLHAPEVLLADESEYSQPQQPTQRNSGSHQASEQKFITYSLPLEEALDSSTLTALRKTFKLTFLPAIHSPAMEILRDDFVHKTLLNSEGNPIEPFISGLERNSPDNPLNFSHTDTTSPILPFSYTDDQTLYERRRATIANLDRSPIVIVTHTLPTAANLQTLRERFNMAKAVNNIDPPQTYIIHIPTSLQDSTSYSLLNNFINQKNLTFVHLISLSPFHPDTLVDYTKNELQSETDKIFKRYWKDLLDPQFAGNAIDVAEGIFFSLFDPPTQRF